MLSGVYNSQPSWVYCLVSTDQLNVPFNAIFPQTQPKYCLLLTVLVLTCPKLSLFYSTLHFHSCKINKVAGKHKTFRTPLFPTAPFSSNHTVNHCKNTPGMQLCNCTYLTFIFFIHSFITSYLAYFNSIIFLGHLYCVGSLGQL